MKIVLLARAGKLAYRSGPQLSGFQNLNEKLAFSELASGKTEMKAYKVHIPIFFRVKLVDSAIPTRSPRKQLDSPWFGVLTYISSLLSNKFLKVGRNYENGDRSYVVLSRYLHKMSSPNHIEK